MVKLSSNLMGKAWINAAAKDPIIMIKNEVSIKIDKIKPIIMQEIKQARLPSKLLSKIFIFPYLEPTISAIISPIIKKETASIAMFFSNKSIVKKLDSKNNVIAETLFFSFSLTKNESLVKIDLLIFLLENLNDSIKNNTINNNPKIRRINFLE